jgi:hypothetical protein
MTEDRARSTDLARRSVSGIGQTGAARSGHSVRGMGFTWAERTSALIRAIRDDDEQMVEDAVQTLSQSRRIFVPLAFVVGAFVMLFDGVKLLVLNWRLALVQILPAMWIWIAVFDLKAHTFRHESFRELSGPMLIAIILAIVAITAASFFLNAVFAFAIAAPPPPKIRPAFAQARSRVMLVLGWGAAVGVLLGVSAVVVDRWGTIWFAICMSIAIGIMIFCYVAVPSRLIGTTRARSRRDKLAASAIGGALGGIVCTPPHVITRVGILMLGSRRLFIPGLFVLTLGVTLHAGASGAVKAIKMSAKLTARHPTPTDTAP